MLPDLKSIRKQTWWQLWEIPCHMRQDVSHKGRIPPKLLLGSLSKSTLWLAVRPFCSPMVLGTSRWGAGGLWTRRHFHLVWRWNPAVLTALHVHLLHLHPHLTSMAATAFLVEHEIILPTKLSKGSFKNKSQKHWNEQFTWIWSKNTVINTVCLLVR